MARYLLELSLLEGQCVVYLPAQLAGAALRLARRVLQETLSPEGETAWCIASSIHIGRLGNDCVVYRLFDLWWRSLFELKPLF